MSAPDLPGDGRDLQGDEKDKNVEGDDVENVETVGRREAGRSAGSAANRDRRQTENRRGKVHRRRRNHYAGAVGV